MKSRFLVWWRSPKRFWFVTLEAALGCCVLAYLSGALNRQWDDLLMPTGGWLLTLTGILLAGQQAARSLIFTALSKLHEDEGHPDQGEAKRKVWQASPPRSSVGFAVNPYSYFRDYLNSRGHEKLREPDDARRRLTHFWYRAAWLAQLGVLTPQGIFDSVGRPDILEVLEPWETILVERIENAECQPRPWPPITLLITWYRQTSPHREEPLRDQLPARAALYRDSNPPQGIGRVRSEAGDAREPDHVAE